MPGASARRAASRPTGEKAPGLTNDPGAYERGAVFLPGGYHVRVPSLVSVSQPVAAVEQFRSCFGATSLGNLPRINQGRQVEADDIHLQFDSIVVLNHSANSILDFAVMQVGADSVGDFELALWFLGWHARECTPEAGLFSRL